MCEAQEALLKLAFELELQWGSGRLDFGKLKGLATGATCTHDQQVTREPNTEEAWRGIPAPKVPGWGIPRNESEVTIHV